MSSRPTSPPASGGSLLLRLAPLLLPLLLSSLDSAEGASFRDYRLRGSEPPREPPHRGPDQDMLKALRHIENLRHRSGGPLSLRLQKPPQGAPGYDGVLLDNAQALRAMLTLRALEQGPSGGEEEERPGWQRKGGAEEEEEEELEGEEIPEQGDKTQEWFQAVLRALERTGPANTAHQPAWGRGPGLRLGERAAASHEATRMMFEEEDGEKGKEEEGAHEAQGAAAEEGEGGERGNPLVRRTGEGVGEQYTPQKLATLQSIFDEVERLATGGKEEEEERGDGEEGQQKEKLNMRSLAYDKVARGLVDWAPLRRGGEEEVEGDEEEEEEEERSSKPQADQVLDYGDDGEDEDRGVEEEDGEDLSARRSINPQPTEDAEDMANLVDYYLLKVLEKTEEEDKREIEEEEEQKERAERKVSQFQYWDNRSPQQDMHQLLRLSQKYHIPPEELLALFQAEDRSKPRSHTTLPQSSGLARSHNRITQKQPSLGSRQNNRYRTPERQSSDKAKDARTLEILSLLGLGSTGGPGPLKRPPPYKVSQPHFQPQPRRQEKYTPAQSPGAPSKLKENYDDNVGEDELAAYMAAKILEQYPAAPMYNKKMGQKRSALGLVWPDEDEEQGGLGSLEQAMQDYFDQMDSDRAAQKQQKRQSEREGPGGVAQTHGPDDDALMKMMTLLTPKGQASQEK